MGAFFGQLTCIVYDINNISLKRYKREKIQRYKKRKNTERHKYKHTCIYIFSILYKQFFFSNVYVHLLSHAQPFVAPIDCSP